MDKMLIVWIIAGVTFFIVEVATSQIVTIWFAVGAIGALFSNVLGCNLITQIIVFTFLSFITLILARTYLKKFTLTNVQPTNADMCIGADAIVIEDINNTNGCGQVKVKGTVWSAKSNNNNIITKDTIVTIKEISGVKLIVEPKENNT